MNNNNFKKILLGFIATSSLLANNNDVIPREYPHSQNPQPYTNPSILKDRFELNIDPGFVGVVQDKQDTYTKVMSETLDINLLIDMVTKPVKNVDTLYIHPHYVTTIAFPDETEILYAQSSIVFNQLSFSGNLLIIQPNKDFVNGNIVVTYRDDKRTYYMNIIVNKYKQQVFKDNEYNKYVIDDNYLSLNYKYVSVAQNIDIDHIAILKQYITLNGEEILKLFNYEGDYDTILVDNVLYYITKDSAFGQVDYNGIRFNISTGYSYADRSINGKLIRKDDFVPDILYKGDKK